MSNAIALPHAAEPADVDRAAFNAAFYELGLRWYWDPATYDELALTADKRSRVQHYIETRQPHLLSVYDVGFLSKAILEAKARCQRMGASSAPRGIAHLDWTDPRSAEIGV